ncbi:hypothetical protein EDB85DRAFT_1891793 [Lactarius pseudohatsudake]|nr:hypothetical protein EDB85DRAFT_1891793 [Lactarius pseudohatsudake]
MCSCRGCNVAFEPPEYPREEDSHVYGVTTKEELLEWVKNGDQTYRNLLVPVCVLASSPSSAFCYKSYNNFFLIILDFYIAVASVWPQPSANRSLIQVRLIHPGRNCCIGHNMAFCSGHLSAGNRAPKKEGAKKVTFSPVITKQTSPNDIRAQFVLLLLYNGHAKMGCRRGECGSVGEVRFGSVWAILGQTGN